MSGLVIGLHAATITAFQRTYAPVPAPNLLPESDALMKGRKPHAFSKSAQLSSANVSRVRDLDCPSPVVRSERLWT